MLRLSTGFSQVRTLAFSPDNRHLLAVGIRPRLGGLFSFLRLTLWDLADLAAEPVAGIDQGLDPIAGYFLSDGRLLGVDNRGAWRICEIGGEKAGQSPPVGRDMARVGAITASPDRKWLALIGRGRVVALPLPGNPQPEWWLNLEDGQEAIAVAYSPGTEVATIVIRSWTQAGREVWVAAIHDADTGKHVRFVCVGDGGAGIEGPDTLFVAPWAPDGRSVARVGRQFFDVFDTFTWQKRVGCLIDGQPLTAATFDPTGRTFLATDEAGLVHFWDTSAWPDRTGEPDSAHPPTRTLDWGIGAIQSLTFSRDGTLGAVAGSRGDVVVWDMDL